MGKLVGPQLRMFALYKREEPFGPKLLNSFLELRADIIIFFLTKQVRKMREIGIFNLSRF